MSKRMLGKIGARAGLAAAVMLGASNGAQAQAQAQGSGYAAEGARAWTIDRTTLVGGRGEDVPVAVALGRDGSAVAAFVVQSGRVTGENTGFSGGFEDGFGDGVRGATLRDLRAGKDVDAQGHAMRRGADEERAASDRDVLLCKYLPGGGSRIWSVLLGGGGDDIARALALDAAGNVFLAGSTDSAALFEGDSANRRGHRDGWVLKLLADGSRVGWSQRIGGGGDDFARAVAVDDEGQVAVLGDSNSDSLSLDQAGVRSQNLGARGRIDTWLARFDARGQMRSVLALGGRGDDFGRALAFDRRGALWAAGETDSPDFPAATSFDRQALSGNNPALQMWLARFTFDSNASRSQAERSQAERSSGAEAVEKLAWVRLWGGSRDESVRGLSVRNGRATVVGFTSSPDFLIRNARSAGPRGGWDAAAARFDEDGHALWSTAWGGSGDDFAVAAGVDARGTTYIAGHTTSPDFPRVNEAQWPLSGASASAANPQAWLCSWQNIQPDDATSSANEGSGSSNGAGGEAARLSFCAVWGGRRDDRAFGLALGRNGMVSIGRTDSPDFPLLQRAQNPAAFDPNASAGDDYARERPTAARDAFHGGVDGWLLWARWPRQDETPLNTPVSDAAGDDPGSAPLAGDGGGGSDSLPAYGDGAAGVPFERDPYDQNPVGQPALDPGASTYYPDPYQGAYYPDPYAYPSPGYYPGGYPSYPSSAQPGEPGGPRPTLTLRVEREAVAENAGPRAILAEVFRNTRTDEELNLSLISSDPARLRVPQLLTIPYGTRSATFWIEAVDNNRRDGDELVSIEVRRGLAPYRFRADRVKVRVLDDEQGGPIRPGFGSGSGRGRVALSLSFVSQAARIGTRGVRGVLAREGTSSRPTRVGLSSSAPELAAVPAEVTIPPEGREVFFNVAVAPQRAQGRQEVTITARAEDGSEAAGTFALVGANGSRPPLSPIAPGKRNPGLGNPGLGNPGANDPGDGAAPPLRPGERQALRLFVFAPQTARPGSRVAVVIERQGGGRGAQEVALASSDAQALNLPTSVTIGAGQPRANVYAVAGRPREARTVRVTAQATGPDGRAHSSEATLQVLADAQAPDAQPAPPSKPQPRPEPKPEPRPEPKPQPRPAPQPQPQPLPIQPPSQPAPRPRLPLQPPLQPPPFEPPLKGKKNRRPEPEPAPAPPAPLPAPPRPAPLPPPEPPRPLPAPEPRPEPRPAPRPALRPEPKPEPRPAPKPAPVPAPDPAPAPQPAPKAGKKGKG